MTFKNSFQCCRLGNLVIEAANGFASGEREQDGTIQVRINNVDLNSSFHEKLYNRGSAHTTLLALGTPPRH